MRRLVLATKSQLTYFAPTMSRRSTPPAVTFAGCPNPAVCPLSKIRAGMAVRIRELSAPPEVCSRLREMGFCEDQQIRLLSQQSNVICQVCNVRLGISAQLADTIMVEPVSAATAR
jgi:ferrous iron transport protein A